MMSKILALDFDGTLVEHRYPYIGELKVKTLEYVKEKQSKGWKVILWTCRSGEELEEAIKFCNDLGLTLDAVNDNIEDVKNSGWEEFSPKVFADIYLDDRCINVEDL
jgi:hydroxymethylpyrimidine pyrophosphatase-like HAD family hydrolase